MLDKWSRSNFKSFIYIYIPLAKHCRLDNEQVKNNDIELNVHGSAGFCVDKVKMFPPFELHHGFKGKKVLNIIKESYRKQNLDDIVIVWRDIYMHNVLKYSNKNSK